MMDVKVSKGKLISRWVDQMLHEIVSKTVHKDKEGD